MKLSISHAVTALLLVGLLVSPVRAADPEPLATSEELHKLFADGQYQPLLAKLPRVLALKGPAAAGYDMVDLNLLKADTFIQLKQQQQANAALNDAQKAITPKTDPKLAAKPRAMQIALKNSTGFSYSPKASKGAKAISLQDMAQRPALFTAMLTDMQTEVGARIKTAQSSKTLPPIITAVQGLADMGAVETVATGTDTSSQKAADDLADGARKLMSDGVTAMSNNVAKIDKEANRLVESPVKDMPINNNKGVVGKRQTVPERRWRKVGLTQQDRTNLKDVIDTCAKIQAACVDFEAVSKVHAGGFKTVAESAARTSDDANATLTADYLTEVVPR